MPINGWIILDKPSGITSAHAVAKVKRLLKPSKIGHAGTLDPLASGILPLALGEATKAVPYMMDSKKAYSFTVNWGLETDTDDLEGKITKKSEKKPSEQEITAILPKFIGEIDQTPPDYSAIKIDGKRAYDLARTGREFEIKTRKVSVDSLSITAFQDDSTTFTCHCGKGTYIRAIARDMGRELGCYGHVTMLRRLKVGKFTENHAISLELLEEMVHKSELDFIQTVESALDDIPAVNITASQAISLKHGQTVIFPENGLSSPVAVFENGTLIAVCDVADGQMKSRRIFNL